MIRDDILDLMIEDRQMSEEQYMVTIARKIKKYCEDKRNCAGCPFAHGAVRACCLSEGYVPYEWDIKDYKPICFKVGDEVRIKGSDPEKDDCDIGVVTYISERYMHVMRKDGSGADENDFENWERTGRYFVEMDELLFNMKFKNHVTEAVSPLTNRSIYRHDSIKEDPDGT